MTGMRPDLRQMIAGEIMNALGEIRIFKDSKGTLLVMFSNSTNAIWIDVIRQSWSYQPVNQDTWNLAMCLDEVSVATFLSTIQSAGM